MKKIRPIITVFFLFLSCMLFAQDKCMKGDCINGYGVYQWADGQRYEGSFLNGKFEGEGTYYWANGNKHAGLWNVGQRHGKGIHTTADGVVTTGVWNHGYIIKTSQSIETAKSQPMTTSAADRKISTKTGCIKGDCHNGSGTFVWEGLGRYEGSFKDDKKNGFGTFYWLDKGKYSGDWLDDKRHGEGIYQFPDLTTVSGVWENGQIKEKFDNMQMPDVETVEEDALKRRTALVIGNADYETTPLPHSKNDADAIAATLSELGFEVTHHSNLDQQKMEKAIKAYGKDLKEKGGTGLFYFAGHGVHFDDKNYLIPVGADIQYIDDIPSKAVNLTNILVELRRYKKDINIVILDAAHSNPLSYYNLVSSGFAPTVILPAGTFVAYSASPGSIASKGEDEKGLYAQELIKMLGTKDLTIEEVFKKVRSNVRKLSEGAQIPWEGSSIEGAFYFMQ